MDKSNKKQKKKDEKKGLTINRFTLIIIGIGIVIIGFICWNYLQEYIFFHPWNDTTAYLKLRNIEDFKEIKISNFEVELSGWFWNIQQKKAPLVIFFGGNGENSSNTMLHFYDRPEIKKMLGNYNIMMVDYPGYGLSKGKPSDESMFIAAEYIFDYANKMDEVDSDNIVILGYSIGTGVATYCASIKNASGLILVAPYDNALSLYNDAIDSFHGSIQSLAKYKFDSSKFAENVSAPTLIFTSKSDKVIDYSHSLDLAGHFSGLEETVILTEVTHNGYFYKDTVLRRINEFLNQKQQI